MAEILGNYRLWIIVLNMVFVAIIYFRWKQIDKKAGKTDRAS